MQRFILLILFALLSPALAGAAPLSLAQCIERGLAFNPEVKAYQLAVNGAAEGINEAWGDFLPTLTLNYSYGEISGGDSNDRDDDFLDQQSDSYSVRLSQPLFSGLSGVAGLKKARQSKSYREYELQSVTNRLVRDIRASYYDILASDQKIAKWNDSVARLEKQRLIAKAWVDVELEPRLRLLEVEVELADARQQLISARAMQSRALARLEELLAFEAGQHPELAGSLEKLDPDPCTAIELCLDQALQQRPELTMAGLNIDMADQDAKTILASSLPRADLDASWNDYKREYEENTFAEEKRDYYNVMLNVSIQPFQGGRNLSAWRQQRINIERLHRQRDRLRQQVTAEVKIQLAQLEESRGRLGAAVEGVNRAREAYQVASRSVELGVVSLRDLLVAELLLTRAELSQIEAELALQIARLQLDYAIGNR